MTLGMIIALIVVMLFSYRVAMILVLVWILIAVSGCATTDETSWRMGIGREDAQHARTQCVYPNWYDGRSRKCRTADTPIFW